MTPVEKIQANARRAIETLIPVSDVQDFGFNRESVEWVDGYIERQREMLEAEPDKIKGLVSVLGCFLGECIIACYGGVWEWDDGAGWSIRFNSKLSAYPINKVQKQFANGAGAGDSVWSFFDGIGPLLSRSEP